MKRLKRTFAIACVAVFVLSLCACEDDKVATIEFDWPTEGLGAMLPAPSVIRGRIKKDDVSEFSAEINKIKEEDYEEYIEACKDNGFDVDIDEGSTRFIAYNEDGYIVQLDYTPSEDSYVIDICVPRFEEGQTYDWPTTGLATLLPEPDSDIGKISRDEEYLLTLYVGESSLDDFNDYIDACIEAGFDVDDVREEDYYSAKDEAGADLILDYLGYNTFSIQLSSYGKSLDELDDALDD